MKKSRGFIDVQVPVASLSNNILEENREVDVHPRIHCSLPKSKGHCHMRAMRKMIKSFLKDLWIEWKKLENEEKDSNLVSQSVILKTKLKGGKKII